MIGLVIGGCIGVVLVLYAADRVLKARAQVRRLQTMSDRLAAAAARAEEQHEKRQAAARAGAALTSVLPAIQRPPLTVPGGPAHGAARPGTGGEHTGQQDHRVAHPGRPPSGTGDHPARSAGRESGAESPAGSPGGYDGQAAGPGPGPGIVVTQVTGLPRRSRR